MECDLESAVDGERLDPEGVAAGKEQVRAGDASPRGDASHVGDASHEGDTSRGGDARHGDDARHEGDGIHEAWVSEKKSDRFRVYSVGGLVPCSDDFDADVYKNALASANNLNRDGSG
mmetsp:Transcript_13722/g.36838  ORF Transcript_13722/g.36838 Transcript_13722/m.36838 type:complete len:118 (+) Transcript_13722:153-506(+)